MKVQSSKMKVKAEKKKLKTDESSKFKDESFNIRFTFIFHLSSLICLWLITIPVFADNSPGSTSGHLLTQTAGARPLGMGDAYSCVNDDIDGVYYNPATLGFMKNTQLSGTQMKSFSDVTYASFGFGLPTRIGVFGITGMTLDAGEMDVYYIDGTQTQFKAQVDKLYGLSYGTRLGKYGSFGVTVKSLESVLIEKYKGAVSVADAGLLFKLSESDEFRVGVSAQNFGAAGIKYLDDTEPIPTIVRGGFMWRLSGSGNRGNITFDIVQPRDESVKQQVGVEYYLFGVLAIRAGFKLGYDSPNVTAGFGIDTKHFCLDYGTVMIQKMEPVTRISMLIKFSDIDFGPDMSGKSYVFGKVTDENDDPVPYSIVQIYQEGHQHPGLVSDKYGVFKTEYMDKGQYEFRAVKQGYVTQKEPVEVTAGIPGRIDFIMPKTQILKTGVVYGVIVDTAGMYVDRAFVTFTGASDPVIKVYTEVYSNINGKYKSPALNEGTYKIRIDKEGFQSYETEYTVNPEILNRKNFMLKSKF
jgi:hypothetical protein